MKDNLLPLVLLFVMLIAIFDTAQQYYYLQEFQLMPSGHRITFWTLMKSHATKWLFWLLFTFPLIRWVNYHPLNDSDIDLKRILSYLGVIFIIILIMISLLTLIILWRSDEVINRSNYFSQYTFIFFQKVPAFFIAYILVVYWKNNRINRELLRGKIRDLEEIRHSYKALYAQVKTDGVSDNIKILHAKVGNRITAIPVDEIKWVQSDDYCVKVYSDSGTHSIRNTMKAMEELLPDIFIRIHRQAIINSKEISEIFLGDNPEVKLMDGTLIPIAKSRLGNLKKMMNTM